MSAMRPINSHVSVTNSCRCWSEEFWAKHFTSEQFAFSCCSFVVHPVCKGLWCARKTKQTFNNFSFELVFLCMCVCVCVCVCVGVFELAWSYWVSSSEKCCPAGSAKARCSDVMGQPHPFLCQLVNIGGPANHNSSADTGQVRHSVLLKAALASIWKKKT